MCTLNPLNKDTIETADYIDCDGSCCDPRLASYFYIYQLVCAYINDKITPEWEASICKSNGYGCLNLRGFYLFTSCL